MSFINHFTKLLSAKTSADHRRFCIGEFMASYDYGKTDIVAYICNNFKYGSTCLDVGACDGKWSTLLSHQLVMDAVEIWEPNIIEWNLKGKYRNVYNADVADLEYEWYDLILFGDVIEHMPVDRAQAVLEYAQPRCRDMIIGVPFNYPQEAIYGNPYEEHIQPDLTPEIFNERYPGYELLCQPVPGYAYYHKGETNG